MLAQRRRRWASIKSTSGQRHVFAERLQTDNGNDSLMSAISSKMCYIDPASAQCWANAEKVGPALGRH